jgi:hypothetical protein
MIEILPPMGKYKYNTWRILPMKCDIDNSVRLWSCIRNVNTLPESNRLQRGFLSSSSIECGSSAWILQIPPESRPSSPSGVSGFWLVEIPMIVPQSGWSANHSKSFIRFSYIICASTYRIVELVLLLSYIRSRVWGSIEYSGARCDNYYLIPRRLTALIRRKILDSANDVVS